jgi:hypothetical protein
MRNRARSVFVICVLIGACALVQGQFQEPTVDELHMTADPKAPGAPAVYLYLEERTDNAIHFHSYYARIKVLTEKGLGAATVYVPYERGPFEVAAIQGRTIHPDGSIVTLKAKPADLLAYKGGGPESSTNSGLAPNGSVITLKTQPSDLVNGFHQFREMVFTLPAATVGSILEYSLQLRYKEDSVSSPYWIIQHEYFVHKAHYFFNSMFDEQGKDVVDRHGQIAGTLMYSSRLRSGGPVAIDALKRYSLDVADVPPLPSGDWLPPLNTVRESVIFYYTDAHTGPEFWDREGKYFARDVERFISPLGKERKELRNAAAGLVSSGDGDEAKARKIYAAVMQMDNRDFPGAGHAATGAGSGRGRVNKTAGDVLEQQAGSGDDLVLTFVALARAAGLKAGPMWVVNRDRALFEATYLSTSQLDDLIAVVEVNGKDVYLDPGQKMCPFGMLNWKHESVKGMLMRDNQVTIAETPAGPEQDARMERKATVTIDARGEASGTATLRFGGQEALGLRQLAMLETESEFGKDFEEYTGGMLPAGVRGKLDGFDGLTDYVGDVTARVTLSGVLGSATGKRLILPGLFFDAHGTHPFAEEGPREVPVDLHYATMEQDEVTYRLPAGMKLESLSTDPGVEWAGGVKLAIQATQGDGSITVKRSFARTRAVLEPSLYNALRFVYQRASRADQQQIVLSRADESAAN